VDIVVGEKDDVLLLPINAVFESDGLPVANVVRPWGVDRRTVELGESNDIHVEVLGGLKEGDRVALVDFAATAPVSSGAGLPSGGGLRPRLPPAGGEPERLAPQ
jgi:hypothetical protein